MKINHAVEVANILRHNIVQGVREADNEEARWSMWIFILPFLYLEKIRKKTRAWTDYWCHLQNYEFTMRLNVGIMIQSRLGIIM